MTGMAHSGMAGARNGLHEVAYVPCPRIENPDELRRLLRLHQAAALHKAELHLLTEDVCGEGNGPRRLRAWLAGRLPDPVVWTP